MGNLKKSGVGFVNNSINQNLGQKLLISIDADMWGDNDTKIL